MTMPADGVLHDDEECRPLPHKAYVSLTEAVTWIVESDSRDDDYLIAKGKQLGPQRRREWCSPLGEPDWLLPHLDLMRQGREPAEEPDDNDNGEIWRGTFSGAKRWLEKSGLSAKEAYDFVAPIVEVRAAIEREYVRCYGRLIDLCSSAEIELLGIEYKVRYPDTGLFTPTSTGVHTPIPYTYFLLPIFHWRGAGYHGNGELRRPDPPCDSIDDILKDIRAWPFYLEVRIKREDALKLREGFLAERFTSETAPARKDAPQRKKRIADVLKYARERWPGPNRPSRHKMATHIENQKKDQGFSVESLRKILSGEYLAMKRLGLKGLDG